MSSDVLYAFTDVTKEYQGPAERLRVLDSVSFTIGQGETIAVVGASGSGKSTLLHLLGTLDAPTSGDIRFEDVSLVSMSAEQKAAFRNTRLGFVFQFHHLLPEFTTLENVAMQALISGMGRNEAYGLAEEALVSVGLGERIHQAVTTLSGGERQRAAIARAVLLRPKVLLADEPTGNLDEKTGEKIARLLLDLNLSLGMTLVIVTHNPDIASVMGRTLEIRAGEVYDQKG